MQLYALDGQNRLVFARQASKQTDYFCLECKSVIRLRGGTHRQNHFYHLEPNRSCRQSGKSMEHLQAQVFFLNHLPEGECLLEHPFPAIHRIADIMWMPQKIVFEIQCSPISANEVIERNRDYQSEGFQTVWILHDHRYNKRRLTAAEGILEASPHYYTDIDADGNGRVYDQFSIYHNGLRLDKLKPLPICVSSPQMMKIALNRDSYRSRLLQNRIEQWPLYFSDDLLCRAIHEDPDWARIAAEVEKLEREYFSHEECRRTWGEALKELLYGWVVRPYRLVFQILLERACK